VTGDSVFVKTYLLADKINQNKSPGKPILIYPNDFDTVNVTPVHFSWKNSTDPDGDPVTYKLDVWPVNEMPDNNKAVGIVSGAGWWSGGFKLALIVGLIGLSLFVLLYYMGLKKKPVLMVLFVLAILAGILLIYFHGVKSDTTKKTLDLQVGRAYFWKVIAEDGKGGSAESETRRLQIK
jgi:hypothetical protein